MENRRALPVWWFDYLLSGLALAGVFIKVLVVEHQIVPKEFTAPRNGGWTLLIVLSVVAFLLSRLGGQRRFWCAWAVNGIGTLMALADLWHVRFYGDVTSIAEASYLGQLPMIAASVQAMARIVDWALFVDLAVLATIALLLHRRAVPSYSAPLKPAALVTGAALLISIGSTTLATWGDPHELFENEFMRSGVVGSVGLVGYHAFDVVRHLKYPVAGRLRAAEHEESITARLETARRERVVSPLAGIARDQNVILISAESLQGFALGLEHDGQPLTPALNAFARESLHFTEYYDQTHLGTTSDAEFTALNSLMPLAEGPVATLYESNDFQALPQVLAARGYQTISACGEPPEFWNMRQIHARYGFAKSMFVDSMKMTEWVGAGLDDASFFRQVTSVLAESPAPFFGFLLTSSNHHPFKLPEHLRGPEGGPWPGTMAGDYIQSVQYFDRSFQKLIDDLRARGLLDRSVIVVYGDHSAFLEDEDLQRVWQALGHKTPAGALDLWRLAKRVPLMIRLPHGEAAGPRDVPAGHLDIAPTILSLIGAGDAPGTWLGSDLTAPARRAMSFHDGSATNGEITVIPSVWRQNTCFTKDNAWVPCEAAAELRRRGEEKIWISKQIVEGNLIPSLTRRFAAAPVKPRDLPTFLAIAHRAGPMEYPENTLAAVRAALALKVDVIEADIQLSRDGIPMLFHDDTLEGTSNGHGLIAALTVAEIKRLDAGSWRDRRFAGERVPTLEEALVLIGNRAALYLDIKTKGLGKPVAALYKRLGIPYERALVGVWTDDQRREFAIEMPGVRLVMVGEPPVQRSREFFAELRTKGYWGVEFGRNWPAEFVGDALLAGVPVLGYDITDDDKVRALRELGVTGVESDYPARLLKLLGREP